MTHSEKYELTNPLLPYLLMNKEDREQENIRRLLGKGYKPFGNSSFGNTPKVNIDKKPAKILDYSPDPEILRRVQKSMPDKKPPSGWGSQIKQDFENAHPRLYRTLRKQNISGKLGPLDIQAGKVKTPFGNKVLGINASYSW